MTKTHLKRYVAPKSWTMHRKRNKFVVRPNPGSHPSGISTSITLLVKQLGYADTTREVKKMLNTKEVFIDKKRVKDHKRPVGFMDVVSFADTKGSFRVLIDSKGRLIIVPIKEDAQASQKICRLEGKKIIKKGKTQLNLSGNRNIIVEKDDYKVGDSLLIELPSQKILQHSRLEKGSMIFLIKGTNVGAKGTVASIDGKKIIYEVNKEKKETVKNYVFVVGKEKELISMK